MKKTTTGPDLFFELTRQKALHKSKVKWFAEFEMIRQIFLYFPQVTQVINNEGCFCEKWRTVLRQIIDQKLIELRMQIALFLDLCHPLYELCYVSEGDGIIAPFVYTDLEIAAFVCNSFETVPLTPLLTQTLDFLHSMMSEEEKQTVYKSYTCLAEPIITEFKTQFEGKHKEQTNLWKFCAIFDPSYAKRMTLLELQHNIELIPKSISALKGKLLSSIEIYKGHAESHGEYSTLLQFWNVKKLFLPVWYEAVQFVALLQPSSAAAERVFASLRSKFGKGQESTLEDYKSTSIMLSFNLREIE